MEKRRWLLASFTVYLVASLMVGCGGPTPVPLEDRIAEAYRLLKQSDFVGAEAAFRQVLDGLDEDEVYAPAHVGLSQVYLWQSQFEDEAMAQALEAVEADPESTMAHAVLALAYLTADAVEDAVDAAEQGVELDESSAFAQAALAMAYLGDREYVDAQEAVEEAYTLDPESADVLDALAVYYESSADYGRSRAAREEAIRLEPEFAPWHASLGWFWRSASRYDEATACFEKALELGPGYVDALGGLAAVSLDKMDYDQSEAYLEQAADLAPQSNRVAISWGYLLLRQEEYDDGRDKFEEVLEADEEDYGALFGIAYSYLLESDCDRAAREFADLVDIQPRYADGETMLGYAKLCGGDISGALECFRSAAELEPYNSEAPFALGLAYRAQGRWDESAEAYTDALRLAPSGAGVHTYLGDFHAVQGDLDAAKVEYELALALDPYTPSAHIGLSDAWMADDRLDKALEHAQQAYALDEDDTEAQLTLGYARLGQDDPDGAAELLELVIEDEPDSPLPRLYLGLAYRDLGRYSDAEDELETFLALVGDTTDLENIQVLIEQLNQGYSLTEEKALSDLDEALEELADTGFEPDMNLDEGDESEGRTLTITLEIGGEDDPESVAIFMFAVTGICLPVLPRVEPPIDNGLVVELEQWGEPQFRAELALDDMRQYTDGLTDVMGLISSMEFTTLVADETASVLQVQSDTAELRGLDPLYTVPYNATTQDELQDRLTANIDEEYEQEVEADDALLTLLGVIGPEVDLGELMIDLYSEQTAGFYDSEEEAFYVVEAEEQTGLDKMTIAHEYVHALQDQHFDLDALVEGLNDDQDTAVSALYEGDATLAMLLYSDEHVSVFDQLQSYSDAAGFESDVYDASPAFIQEAMMFPYVAGLNFVMTLYDSGGWEAVNAAYANPPMSTEQVLHPEAYRRGEEPVDVSLADLAAGLGDGWEELDNDVLGELGIMLMLSEHEGPAAAELAAEGWGGDRYVLLQQGDDGPYVLAIQACWDDGDEVDEFWALYEVYMRHRTEYSERVDQLVGEVDRRLWASDDQVVLAVRGEDCVTIVVAADDNMADEVIVALGPD